MKQKDAMDDIFRIQLKIDGKTYPLFCKRSEEKFLRDAATLINKNLILYGNKYQGVEKKDLIVFVACHNTAVLKELQDQQNETPAYAKIERLNAELEDFIEKEEQQGS